MHKRARYLLLFLLIAILSGCFMNVIRVAPRHRFNKSYTLKEPQVRAVGNSILRVENVFFSPTFTPRIDHNYEGVFKLSPGQIWVAVGSLDGEGGYLIVPSRDYNSFLSRSSEIWAIHITEEGKIGKGLISNLSRKSGSLIKTKEVLFEEIDQVSTEEGGFAAELIYSGISGSTLRISYREYANDLARPAFSQDLTYNLSESNIITFRSMKIKIYRADNSEIEFSVEEDGGLPWVPRERGLSQIR